MKIEQFDQRFFPDKQCDSLLDPVHGEVHQTGRYLGDRAIYTCIPGNKNLTLKPQIVHGDNIQ
jgi:hypothetical protein